MATIRMDEVYNAMHMSLAAQMHPFLVGGGEAETRQEAASASQGGRSQSIQLPLVMIPMDNMQGSDLPEGTEGTLAIKMPAVSTSHLAIGGATDANGAMISTNIAL